MTPQAQKVYLSLQRLCARQECCSRDIYQKALRRLEGDSAAAQEVLSGLIENKFVDDARYALAFAREKAAITGWGPLKIRMALCAKGINIDDTGAALCGIEASTAGEKLRKVVSAKWRTLKEDPQGKLKLIKFALSRGYEYDDVKDAVEAVISADSPEL